MYVLKRFTLAIVLSLALLGGCDGRGGSSGFDVNNENAAISRALASQQCVDFQGLSICPADQSATETPTPGSASTPTPVGAPSVDTSLGNATSVDCFQSTPGGPCTFVVTFVPHAFQSDTTFQVLARPGTPDSPWVLGADPIPGSGSDASSFTATLVLASPLAQVQFAILAFAGTPPASPSEVQELHQTAASFAFVTQVLAVNVVTPTATPAPTGRPTNTPTPTQTPGAGDCCQCASSCAAPVNGSCGDCTVVFGTACYGELLCVLHTPTPTVTPTPTPVQCFEDNSDGTVSDVCTGLMWEKKDQAGGLHDYASEYPWAGVCADDNTTPCQPDAAAAAACASATNGAEGCSQCAAGVSCNDFNARIPVTVTTIWSWLAQLNQGQGFAGHTDWHIPTVGKEGDTAELETILVPTCATGSQCVSPVFNTDCPQGSLCGIGIPCDAGWSCATPGPGEEGICQPAVGCTLTSCSCTLVNSLYWSATSDVSSPDTPHSAWGVFFGARAVGSANKRSNAAVRAVRGRVTPTPTSTPGPNDCCQCPSSCAAPVDGTCSGGCTVVAGAACGGEQVCTLNTPTPSPAACLTDNGDGTVSDACSGLMWEKKDQDGGLHDYGTLYTWTGACTGNTALCQPNAAAAAACAMQTGGAVGCDQCASGTCIVDPDRLGAVTTIWDWLSQLNASAFAGYNDWRIPSVGYEGDTAELETIFVPVSAPCSPTATVPAVFNTNCTVGCTVTTCSCTASDRMSFPGYWAATTYLPEPGFAEILNAAFCGDTPGFIPKTNAGGIRAVRGGG